MKPLLKIQSIPIKIEAQTRRASFQQSASPAPAARQPLPRVSVPQPAAKTAAPPADLAAQQADRAVYQRQTAEQQAARGSAQNGAYSSSQQVEQAAPSVADTVIGQSLMSDYASNPRPAQTVPQTTSVDYQMDQTTFDWSTSSMPQLEFVPAQIEYTITQYPQIIIEYVGEPIYVPESSNPKYKGTA